MTIKADNRYVLLKEFFNLMFFLFDFFSSSMKLMSANRHLQRLSTTFCLFYLSIERFMNSTFRYIWKV